MPVMGMGKGRKLISIRLLLYFFKKKVILSDLLWQTPTFIDVLHDCAGVWVCAEPNIKRSTRAANHLTNKK